jgi:hypothetical protein
MPVEIRELVIRAVISDSRDAPAVTTNREHGNTRPAPAPPPDDQDAIVAECVKQVMRILQKKRER